MLPVEAVRPKGGANAAWKRDGVMIHNANTTTNPGPLVMQRRHAISADTNKGGVAEIGFFLGWLHGLTVKQTKIVW